MGRSLLFGAVMCAILLAAATTRSDVALPADSTTTDSTTDTTVDTSTQIGPSAEAPQKDPFVPFGVGPPESIWPYSELLVR